MRYYAFLSTIVLVCTGCIQKEALEFPQNSQQHTVYTNHFNIATAVESKTNQGKSTDILRIYLEGDGRAWRSRYLPSADPTPTQSVVVALFSKDPTKYKAYIARPCQFISNSHCQKSYWTDARYSEEVVQSMNQAVNATKQRTGVNKIQFVGHSGGGAIALLLAARRNDVESIITLAGNLDHENFSKQQNLTPLKASLNPADYMAQTKHIPQIHFAGAEDKVIFPSLVKDYTAQANSNCVKMEVLPQTTHLKGWMPYLQRILTTPINCKK